MKSKEQEIKLQQNGAMCTVKNKMTLNETVREALGIALLQSMESKPFCEITVSEIAAMAGVSRSSFYRNFTTKEELLNGYIISLYRSFFKTSGVACCTAEGTDMKAFLETQFRFVKEHGEIYRALYQHNLLYHFFRQTEQELIVLMCGLDESLSSYHRAMLSGAWAGMIRCWIEHDFKESEETMAVYFSNSFRSVLLNRESSV